MMKSLTHNSRTVSSWLLISDVTVLVLGFNIVHRFRMGMWVGLESPTLYALVGIVILTLYVLDAYRTEFPVTVSRLPLRAGVGVWIAGIMLAVYVYIVGPADFVSLFGRGVLPVVLILFSIWAAFSRYLASSWAEKRNENEKWICIGSRERIQHFLNEFSPKVKIDVLLYPNNSSKSVLRWPDGQKFSRFRTEKDLEDMDRVNADVIILATSGALPDILTTYLMRLRLGGVKIYDLSEFYELFVSKVPVFHLEDGWFAYSQGFDLLHHVVGLRIKRVIDIFVSMVGLIILSPLVIVSAIFVAIESPGPMFYRQTRTGLNGMPFRLVKLRSMVENAEASGPSWAKKNDPRVTRVGRFLRRSRIDELPQLWNVFKGEMSFIGPRPERPEFNKNLEKEIPYYDMRHLVKPGITGWAQVMHPYGASIKDSLAKLEYDLYYIKNYSLMLDLAIVLKTFKIVLLGKGV